MSKLVLDSKGLVLAPGELSRAGGSLIQADNVNVEAPGVIRSRNGFVRQTNGVGGPGWKFCSTKELGSNLLFNHGSNTSASGLKYGDGSAAWTTLSGTYTNQPATRMQTAVSRRNHYITTDEGVRRIESDYSVAYAGMPKGLGLDLGTPTAILVRSLNYNTQSANFHVGQVLTGGGSGATGTIRADNDGGTAGVLALSAAGAFTNGETITDTGGGTAVAVGTVTTGSLADASSRAYRVTWAKKDVQGIVMRGAPGDRRVVYNNTRTTGWSSGVASDVLCRILIPMQAMTASTALTTSYYWELWRSKDETVGIIPSDDMRLVGSGYLTAGNISAGYVEFVDSAPEAYRLLGEALYTSPTIGGDPGIGGPGIDQSNIPPPRARDVTLFAECLFYSDLTYPSHLDITILSVVAGVGLTAADTLTIGGITYTAHGSTTSNNQFVVVTSTGPTATTNSEAIERTAQNLCACINSSTTNTTIWAFYASGPGELPGKIRLEARVITSAFTAATSAHGTAYRPSLAATVTADTDIFANGWTFSKPAQGDAVPVINTGFLGRDDTALLRMQVLGESMFFFTDSGIYRLTGRSFDDFAVQEFDLTFRLIGRELVTVCDDAIYAWGYEGIAKITSGGLEYISNAIEPMLWAAVSQIGLTWLSGYAWAAAFRSRHKVLFAFPTSNSSANAGNSPTVLVYDTRMQAWTRWTFKEGTDTERTAGHSTGCVRVSDDLLFLGQWNSLSSDAKVFKERRDFLATDYKDDTFNQTDQAITKTLKWNAIVGSPEMTTHWDELHILYDVSTVFPAWTTPTALTVQFTADFNSSGAANAVAPTATSKMSRASVPKLQRISARQIPTIVHATAEYFGLEGLALVHRSEEGNATVRT